MGIVIHGMKMPKNENDFVKLVIFNDGRCFVAVGENEVTSKTGVVTARELPPHGDLIDRSKIVYSQDGCGFRTMEYAHRAQLDNMIPVIPAEEE